MINSFKELGEKTLEGLSESERKEKFLLAQTVVPNAPDRNNEDRNKFNEIVINLDTEKKEIEVKIGEELSESCRERFFGFELLGRRSKKTYFTTNNLYYHLLTIPDILEYIDKNFPKDKTNDDFRNYLKNLKNTFYDTNKNKSFLRLSSFIKEQRNKISQYLDKDKEINHNTLSAALEEFVSKDILGSSQKNFITNLNIFSLKIDNKYITETIYKEDYIDLIYYERQGRFFDKTEKYVKSNKLCNVCGEYKLISGKVDIPTKFYITDKPYFFENLDKDTAYKSFAICENCYQEVMIGIKNIENNYSGKLFYNLNYYLIPKDIDNNINYQKELEKVKRKLKGKDDGYHDDLTTVKRIKKRNIKVDFLFWYRPMGQAAAFVVADNINDVYYSDIEVVFDELKKLNRVYRKYFEYPVTLNSIYWLLFPNSKSQGNVDTKIYRKEILNLFESIIKGRTINYQYLINKFNFIFRKTYFKSNRNLNQVIYNPLQMNIILSWFNNVAKLEGGFKVKEGSSVIKIENEDINEFFEVHSDIYEGNFYRQGLFILGVLMNQILKEQQNKSSTILNKLDFDGLGVRRVNKFIMDITESLNIYDKFRVNQLLHAQMLDRLQGIEDSSLKKDEVVFYILSGISFGRFLGHKYSQ
ncbi:MAG: type I-B CRISPR-associated protein Cas8b/Csh1 [bacterium]